MYNFKKWGLFISSINKIHVFSSYLNCSSLVYIDYIISFPRSKYYINSSDLVSWTYSVSLTSSKSTQDYLVLFISILCSKSTIDFLSYSII